MITSVLGAIATAVTSGAGGAILGSVTGLWKQSQERKERIELAKISLARDRLDLANEREQRQYELERLERGAKLELDKVETEGQIELEMVNTAAIGRAQDALSKLNTSTKMDNFRASVRPTIAYWAILIFSCLLIWAFWEFKDLIDANQGLSILLGMFATLEFTVSSVVSFYYVSRRNAKPNV